MTHRTRYERWWVICSSTERTAGSVLTAQTKCATSKLNESQMVSYPHKSNTHKVVTAQQKVILHMQESTGDFKHNKSSYQQNLRLKHWGMMWIVESWASIVAIMSIKQSQHDWRAAECNVRTQHADRYIRFTVSCGSLLISTTSVCCSAELSQWAPRVLFVQTGSRGTLGGRHASQRSQWNFSQGPCPKTELQSQPVCLLLSASPCCSRGNPNVIFGF